MAKAFGVEQEVQTTGFSANPNNTPVTRPRGINPAAISRAGADITKGVTDFVEDVEEGNIVRSIAGARDKMRMMEGEGRTPVEISTFRDKAASDILKRFPTQAALTMVNQGLRKSRVAKQSVLADGTIVNVDDQGNIISIADINTPDEALRQQVMTHAVNVEADMPTYANVGTAVFDKASEAGVDASDLLTSSVTLASVALGKINNEIQLTQQKVQQVGVEQGQAIITRSKNGIFAAINQGLLELQGANMHELLSNSQGTITPADVTALGNAYIADMMGVLQEQGAFELYNINAIDFQTQLKTTVNMIGEQATASFNRDVTGLERAKSVGELNIAIAENEVLNNLRETQPEAFRVMTISDNMKDLANVLTVTKQLEGFYASGRPATQNLALEIMTAVMGRSATAEMASVQLYNMPVSDFRSVESIMNTINMLTEDPGLTGKVAIKNYLDFGEFETMRRLMEDAGRADEFDRWFKDYNTYINNLNASADEAGTTLESMMEGYTAVRDEATSGATLGLWDAFVNAGKEVINIKPREAEEEGVTDAEQEAAAKTVREQLGEAE